jgi:hypothetical protein
VIAGLIDAIERIAANYASSIEGTFRTVNTGRAPASTVPAFRKHDPLIVVIASPGCYQRISQDPAVGWRYDPDTSEIRIDGLTARVLVTLAVTTGKRPPTYQVAAAGIRMASYESEDKS